MAPEVLLSQNYDGKADLWSVGIILYEMVYGRIPYRASSQLELSRKIVRGALRFPDELADKKENSSENQKYKKRVPDDLKDMMKRLLKPNQIERMSFEEFFMHSATNYSGTGISYRKSDDPFPQKRSDTGDTKKSILDDVTRLETNPASSFEPQSGFRINVNRNQNEFIHPQTLPSDLDYFRKPPKNRAEDPVKVFDHKAAFSVLGNQLHRSSSLGSMESASKKDNEIRSSERHQVSMALEKSQASRKSIEITGAFIKKSHSARKQEDEHNHAGDKANQTITNASRTISQSRPAEYNSQVNSKSEPKLDKDYIRKELKTQLVKTTPPDLVKDDDDFIMIDKNNTPAIPFDSKKDAPEFSPSMPYVVFLSFFCF
jgi:hypothetical protein